MSEDSGEWTVATNRRHDRKKPPNKRKMTEEELRAYEEKEEKKLRQQREKALAAAASLSVSPSSPATTDPAVAAAVAAASSVAPAAPAAASRESKQPSERGQRPAQKDKKRLLRTRCVLIASSETEKKELVTAITGRNYDTAAVLFAPSAIANFPSGGATPVASVEEASAAMDRVDCVVALAAAHSDPEGHHMAPEVEEVAKYVLGAGCLVEVVAVDSKMPKRKKNAKEEPFKLVFDLSKESKEELIGLLGLSPAEGVREAYAKAGLVPAEKPADEKPGVIDVFPSLLNTSVTTYHGKDYIEGCKRADELIQNISYLIRHKLQPFYAFRMEFFTLPQAQQQQRTTPGKEEKEGTRVIYTIGADGSAPIADGAASFLGDRRTRRLQIVVNKYKYEVADFAPEKDKMVITFDRMIIVQPTSMENPLAQVLLPDKAAQDALIKRLEARLAPAEDE